ncbi:hypothetical protein GE09DRAFT_1213640 [Coniochaeta sp. 2T2.1]|nr:hypothetical protein GE09DRAFT_1213640 [Coniochaeta sp. 2T2.1]
MSSTPQPILQPMQHLDPSLSQRWLFIEQWRQRVTAACDSDSNPAEQLPARGRPDASSHKRKRPAQDSTLRAAAGMSTPPPSNRAQSPSKRMKVSHRNRDPSLADDDDPFLASGPLSADPDETPRRNTTAGILSSAPQLPPRPPSYTSSPKRSSAASRTTTSTTKSRARSTSPTKKTQGLVALRKPIYHVPLDDQNKDQLPEDIRELYNRLYDIAVEHEGIAPWEVWEEINAAAVRPFKESCFKRRQTPVGPREGNATTEEEDHHAVALAELKALRRLEREAWDCRRLCRAELAWNFEVHFPLLKLALDRQDDLAPNVYADKKMVDLAIVLVPEVRDYGRQEWEKGQRGAGRDAAAREERYLRLAHAIQRVVHSQPQDRQSINQTMYTPLYDRPIGVSIETKAEGANEEGRVQLAVWTAAWHERMRDLMVPAGIWSSETRLITMPLLLIVGHTWVLSFACDRGDRLEIVGEMTLGETATLKGLYTLVAALRELARWMQGQFAEWMLGVLEACTDV